MHLNPIEKGRLFFPPYENELTEFEVVTAEWHLIAEANFGPGRGSTHMKWTGDSYMYGIFKSTSDNRWALRWWNGSGEGWLVWNESLHRDVACLLDTIARMPDEPRRWDHCHSLWQIAEKTARASARSEARRYQQAFVEGRLKKRKQRGTGQYKVWIEPRKETVSR